MIQIRGLTFSYEQAEEAGKNAPVLLDIDLDIEEGEWLAVIGANGSGKSTLARQLNGLLLPDSGTVTVDGMSTLDGELLPRIRERVAFVFQNPDNQLVASSVEEDIAFGPENLGLPREQIGERVERALDITGLQDKRFKPPHLLSGGEKQRVAIAGALAMASKYMVLDEPTSMLDPQLRADVLATLNRLHQELGMGVVYITNIMEEALLATRIAVLDAGRLLRVGTPAEIFADAEWLRRRQLNMPQIGQIAALLAARGYPRLAGVLRQRELVEKIISGDF
ncbi:MAG: energy-coupling factor transporter ATPase [Bacillota bacterium]|nr:energy-coupling factor transporter ATPase [Bacillota bacterium]